MSLSLNALSGQTHSTPMDARVAARIEQTSDRGLIAMTAWPGGLPPATAAMVAAEAEARGIALPDGGNAPPPPPAPTAEQLAAVRLAADLIRADTPGNVVPPQGAVRALWGAGLEWRCRLARGGKQSRKGDYQWRLRGERMWRVLARTPRGGAQ